MNKIATHDSATGERGYWYCIPLIPFARTQSKTLVEQYKAGCRVFDLRIKKHRGEWHSAHGIWITKKTIDELLDSLESIATEPTYVSITYEGKKPNTDELTAKYHAMINKYNNLKFMYLAIKYGSSDGLKVQYSFLEKNNTPDCGTKQGFKQLDGRSWHTYIPIPWLWDRIYCRPHKFNENEYIFVDFL